MLKDPSVKYKPVRFDFPQRTWPGKTITKAPTFLFTDHRDGNQAIENPMNVETKHRYFDMLAGIGAKEIEVGFPSASDTEMRFVRELIENERIPDDVTIQVLTQAREDLIRKTVESVEGAKQAVVHLYMATNDNFRETVLGKTRDEVTAMTVESVKLIKELTDARPETKWTLEFSPEHFTSSDLDYARDVCDAVTEAWGATPERKVILNLPATVECCMPNVYADQIEWMCHNVARRDSVVISVHTHNDMGMGVAATMLALQAGAERVEAVLFGNGERTGNAPAEVIAMNLYAQGIHPGLDFSNIAMIARTAEACTGIPVHPRHPYAGDFVFTAWSGSHQDAIKKGMDKQNGKAEWNVPYLLVDPQDIGSTYEALIRVNSQSGKGGISYIMESAHGIVMPRRAQIEFSGVVQKHSDASGTEITAEQLWSIFKDEYLENNGPVRYVSHRTSENGQVAIGMTLTVEGGQITLTGEGNGPINAAVNALGYPVHVNSYEEKSLEQGSRAAAAAFVELNIDNVPGSIYGIGIHTSTSKAPMMALVSGINRAIGQGKLDVQCLLKRAVEPEPCTRLPAPASAPGCCAG